MRAPRGAVPFLLALATATCAREQGGSAAAGATERAAELVRQTYQSGDLVAAAAYPWTAPDGEVFLLVDVESAVAGVVQARADLWVVGEGAPIRVGRSDVMPSAATIGVFSFSDVTGDGLPDLLGFVADSAGVSFPIFLAGARGMMADQLESAAPGYRLSAQPEQAPTVYAGLHGSCAIQVWTDEPAPDSLPAGWRYFPLLQGGQLGPPTANAPACQ